MQLAPTLGTVRARGVHQARRLRVVTLLRRARKDKLLPHGVVGETEDPVPEGFPFLGHVPSFSLCGRSLQQQIEDPESTLPALGLWVLEFGIKNLEGAGEGEAQSSGDLRELRLRLLAVGQIQRGKGDQL